MTNTAKSIESNYEGHLINTQISNDSLLLIAGVHDSAAGAESEAVAHVSEAPVLSRSQVHHSAFVVGLFI